MIVVGAGHDGGYGRVVLGSTAHRLLHSSTVPVAVATRGYRASDHGRVVRATCAFRGDEASRRTLARGRRGLPRRRCRAADRHVRRPRPHHVPARGRDVLRGRRAGGLGRPGRGLQRAAIDEVAAAGPLPEPLTHVVAAARDWVHALDAVPWERDEVLVVGSSSASLMSRLFLGSNGAKILRHSPVPVVVVP